MNNSSRKLHQTLLFQLIFIGFRSYIWQFYQFSINPRIETPNWFLEELWAKVAAQKKCFFGAKTCPKSAPAPSCTLNDSCMSISRTAWNILRVGNRFSESKFTFLHHKLTYLTFRMNFDGILTLTWKSTL